MSDASLPPASGAAGASAPLDGRPLGRRSFYFWFATLVGALTGTLTGLPLLRYLFNSKRQTTDWITLGPVDSFTVGEMRLATFADPLPRPCDNGAAEASVFVRREEPGQDGAAQFRVLAIACPHQGCDVVWSDESGLFDCPCHGGVFNADGNRLSGPPPRGLFACIWRTRQQQLEIRAPFFSPAFHAAATDEARSE